MPCEKQGIHVEVLFVRKVHFIFRRLPGPYRPSGGWGNGEGEVLTLDAATGSLPHLFDARASWRRC